MLRKTFPLLVISLLLISALPASISVTQNKENIIFFDDFESYSAGTFPSAGGWELMFDGRGAEYQVVTDSRSFSGDKSLQLWGMAWWSAVAQRKFQTDSKIIGCEEAIMISDRNPSPSGTPYERACSFWNGELGPWGKRYVSVLFDHRDLKIKCNDGNKMVDIGSWSPQVWYRIKLILNRETNLYKVWINERYIGEFRAHPEFDDPYKINAIELASEHPGVIVYHDDVKVFAVEESDLVIDARVQLYENYAKALDPSYWVDKGNEMLLMFGEDFMESFTTPLGILKTGVKKIALGKYSSAELLAKEVITISGVLKTYDIGNALYFTYYGVSSSLSYTGKIINPHEKMKEISNLIKEQKYSEAVGEINDLLDFLRAARDKVDDPSVIVMNQISKERAKKILESAIAFLEGELLTLYQDGETIILQEAGQKLYLHVYDVRGNHVGMNHDSGRVEIEIPSSSYIDLDNATAILLPSNVTEFRCVIDARYAEAPVENYTLTVSYLKDGLSISKREVRDVIERGSILAYDLKVDFKGEMNVEKKLQGDLNRNGRYDVGDAVIALRVSSKIIKPTPNDIAIGDMNGNGNIDIGDAVLILKRTTGAEVTV